MYELLLRIETLLMDVQPPALLGIGAVALVIGLIFWLGGTRYSTGIVGLIGATIGAAAGLIVSGQFDLHPWLSMLVGAVVVAALAILLKKALILALAVLIISAVSGAGYVSVVLDHMTPAPASETSVVQQPMAYQSFLQMEPDARLNYINRISNESQTFAERLRALFADTWAAIQPHKWIALIAIVAGAVLAIVLVWLIARIVIALAYSIVGVTILFFGLQAALLSVNIHAASELYPRPWLLPAVFLVLVVVGWAWQLIFLRPVRVKHEPAEVHEEEVEIR
jgi:hypothetical protein